MSQGNTQNFTIGAFTGNALTATTLETPRTINGVSFDGSANITVAAAAGTLTGTTLASNVVSSSLTSVGTIAAGVWNGTSVTVPYGGTGRATATDYAVLCGGTTSTGAHQSIASVGTAGQVLVSNGAGALPTFQAVPQHTQFTSSAQVITSAGTLTLAHGLGSRPNHVHVILVCQTAEANYSVGDLVIIGYGNQGNNQGVAVTPDATNIVIRYGSAAGVFSVINKTTGASVSITNGNWRALIMATVNL